MLLDYVSIAAGALSLPEYLLLVAKVLVTGWLVLLLATSSSTIGGDLALQKYYITKAITTITPS